MQHRWIGTMCSIALATGLLACDGPGVVSPTRGVVGRAGVTSASLSLVGTWRRTIFFVDDVGIARSSETTWQFAADGGAARVQVSRNFTFGLADVLVSAGRYRLSNTTIIIDLVTPSPLQLQFEVRLTGDQLELAGQTYLRVRS